MGRTFRPMCLLTVRAQDSMIMSESALIPRALSAVVTSLEAAVRLAAWRRLV